jgi:hypothetical protein
MSDVQDVNRFADVAVEDPIRQPTCQQNANILVVSRRTHIGNVCQPGNDLLQRAAFVRSAARGVRSSR